MSLPRGFTQSGQRQAYGRDRYEGEGGGNGCLAIGNPHKQVLRNYHDDTSQQVEARSLIRYTLGLPVSVAVIGVASINQLKANVTVAKETRPMSAAERIELENHMG